MDSAQHFRGRVLYYWSGMYHMQLHSGEDYARLRPAISICLLNQRLFPEVDAYHLAFRLLDQEQGVCFSEHIQVHTVEFPKFRLRLEELQNPLEKWVYFFLHAESLDTDDLPVPFREPVFERAIKELSMLTQGERERERYESRQKAIRDQMSLLNDASEQGLQQGLEMGELIGSIRVCERQLKRPLTPTEELKALSAEDLRRRCGELEAELFGQSD